MGTNKDIEQISFRVSRELADAVRQKLLDHKKATRKRVTITEILTEALEEYVRGENKKIGGDDLDANHH